jgi:hypothetical protein
MVKRKNTDQVQIKLRLVEALRKRLEDVAKEERRSLNSQLILALEQWLDFREQLQEQEASRRWDKSRFEAERSGPQARPGPPARQRLIESNEEPELPRRAPIRGKS